MEISVRFEINGKITKVMTGILNPQAKEDILEFTGSEVLRICDPYIPFDRGQLKASGTENTVLGSGEVTWETPYARYMYYGKLMVDSETGSTWSPKGGHKVLTDTDLTYGGAPVRGAYWYDRAMQNGGRKQIEKGVRTLCLNKYANKLILFRRK